MPKPTTCKITGCSRISVTRGWCESHYTRWRRYGNPLEGSTYSGAAKAFVEFALSHESNDCLIWPFFRNKRGYAKAHINGKMRFVHRYVCEQVNGPPKTGQETAHTCGKGKFGCVNKKHVVWKTHAENARDSSFHVHGSAPKGEGHYRAKLTSKEVRLIRRAKETQSAIAKKFNISQRHVSRIKSRQEWEWLL